MTDNLNKDWEEELEARQEEEKTSPIKDLSFSQIYAVYLETVSYGKDMNFRWFQKLKKFVNE